MILHRTTSCIRARRVPIYGTQWWNNIITDWDDNIRVHLRQAEAAAPPLPLPCGETALIDGSFRVIATQQHGIYKPMFMYLPTLRILNKMASGEMEKGKVGEKWSISFQWGANDVRGQKESFQNLLLSCTFLHRCHSQRASRYSSQLCCRHHHTSSISLSMQ